MRRIVALCVVIALTSCVSYQKSREYAATGGTLLGGTLLIGTYVTVKSDSIDAKDASQVMVPLMLVGAVIMFAGLVGMRTFEEKPRQPDMPVASPIPMGTPPPGPVDPVGDMRKRNAWSLYQEARVAAYNHDCGKVEKLARQVIEADRATFDGAFSHDAYILACAPQPHDPAKTPPKVPLVPLDPPIPPPPPVDPGPEPAPSP